MSENEEYPSNSHTSRLKPPVPVSPPPTTSQTPQSQKPEAERPKAEKVIEGTAVKQRKTVGSRLRKIFTGVSPKDIFDDVLEQAIIPGIKGLLRDSADRALDRWLGNGPLGSNPNARAVVTNVAHVAYNRISTPTSVPVNYRDNLTRPPMAMSRRGQATFDFSEIEFANRRDASIVLDLMYDRLQNYGTVSVAEFYGWADVQGNFTDRNYGWRDLTGAGPTSTGRGTYILNLPYPVPISG